MKEAGFIHKSGEADSGPEREKRRETDATDATDTRRQKLENQVTHQSGP